MSLLQRPGELTYYEGLGISSTASPDEIRDAFRALVRLLHPDQQLDEQLRLAAEIQMRKINSIYAVLSDPERRRRYDYSLEAPARPTIVLGPDSGVKLRRLMQRFAWIGAAAVILVVLVWLAQDGPAAGSFSALDHAGAQKPPAASNAGAELSADVVQLRSEVNAARAERDAAIHELARLRGRPVRISGASATPVPELPDDATFAGAWVYNRPAGEPAPEPPALYPPEFIEATLNQEGGVIHGQYHSRFQIVDRAISPDVNFEFTGNARGASVACPWRGPGGAKGELTMKLTGRNALEIEWNATELGSVQGLVSGTARLIRRRAE